MLFETKHISDAQVLNGSGVYSHSKSKNRTQRKISKSHSGEESKKIKELSIREKISLIEYSETHTVRDTASEFKVSLGTVVNIKKRKEEYLKLDNEENLSNTRKRKFKDTPYGELNKLCWTWFSKSRSMNMPLSGPIIQETARKFAAELKLPAFKGSNGWLLSFTKAHNINLKMTACTETFCESDTSLKFANNLKHVFMDYQPGDVFNVAETTLCWRGMPERSWLQTRKMDGGKLAREKVVVLLAVSGSGEKLKPLIVGRCALPECGKMVNVKKLQVEYRYNKTSWMTSHIFREWLHSLNEVFIQQNRKVLFFIHSSPSHQFTDLSNINICLLPPSFLQPLDHSIFSAFKTNYRKILLKHAIVFMDLHSNTSLFDMLLWVRRAWQEVPIYLIQNSYRHCGFSEKPDAIATSAAIPAVEPDAELNELIEQMHSFYLLKDKLTADEFHQLDKQLDDMQLDENCSKSTKIATLQDVSMQADVGEVDNNSCIDLHAAMSHVRELKQFTVHNDVDLVDDVLNIERKLQDTIVGSQHFALTEFFY